MSVEDFLKGLPCYNANNFSLFNVDNGIRISQRRPSAYISTEDHPADQIITLEKRSVLLRYLNQQWDRKGGSKKREHPLDEQLTVLNCKKKLRMESYDVHSKNCNQLHDLQYVLFGNTFILDSHS